MDFTKEQLKAANYTENKSAAVSASAGSGKTAVLVEHIARLISDKKNGTSADKIAAVTFTEKAAAELRQRLENRVRLLMAENPGDEFFRDQLVRLSCAHISTISSFCLDIIRENDLYLPNLPNDFNVCDETKAGELSAKAIRAVLSHIYDNFSDKEQYFCARLLGDETEITAKIKQLHSFLSNLPNPKEWRNRQVEIYSSPDLFRKEYTKKAAELFVGYLDEAAALQYELTPYFDEKETAKLAEKLDYAVEALKELREPMLNLSDFQSMENLLEKVPPAPTLKSPFNKDNFLRKLTEKIDSCKKIGKLILSGERDRAACLEQLTLLIELEEIYDKEFRLVKEKEGVLDFSDIERYALEVLSSEECKDYGKNNFDYIIVDEFQDSNDIQYEIFKLLSKEEKNLYLVGDVKQSIYGFRNANPDIFAGLFRSPKFNTLLLNSNFRSSEDVIETVNLCFGQAFEQFKIEWQDMEAGRGIKKSPKNKSEIVIINSIGSGSTREPSYIAKRINEMVKSGFTVHNKDNSLRPCGYGDFAVLLRNNSYCATYRKVFEECGIPCISVGDKAFTDLAEVKNAMAILETVLHPADDFSAATAMMCPAYGFTAEEMAQLKLWTGNNEYQSLYKSLSQAEKLNSSLGEKAKKFLQDMRLFRKTAVNSVAEELIRTIYSRTNLDRLMAVGAKGHMGHMGHMGIVRRENLRLLLHYAKNYPVANDFVAMMKNISKNKLEMPQAVMSEEAEKMVKIMTIHGSKGLQFPVVFLGSTNGSAPKTEKSSPFIFSKEVGAGIAISDCTKKYTFNTLSHQLLINAEKDKEQAEELRLLYVALTRAEEKLIITAKATLRSSKEGYDEEAFPVWQMGNIFSFFYDIAVGNPNIFEMTRIRSFEDCTPEINEDLKEKEEKNPLPDFEAVKSRLEYKYPYDKAVKTPAKFTATALGVVTEESEENTVSTAFYMGLPLFMKEGHSLTPKERGDLYHKVMEKIDFSALYAEEELTRLEKEGEITAKEKGEVDPKEIQAFLDSPLAKRAIAAKKIYREFPLFTTINAAGEENPDHEDLSFIQGVADMFIIENNEIILVDYKTNRNITEEKLINEYKGQLKIYKKALEEMLGLKVKECILFSFSLKKEIPVNPN